MDIIRPLVLSLIAAALHGCIGTDMVDDFVEPRISITNEINIMLIGDSYQFEAVYFDQTGVKQPVNFNWVTSNSAVLEISEDGLATALVTGNVEIAASANQINKSFSIEVLDPSEVDEDSVRMMQDPQNGERTAELKTVSSYPLEGTATLRVDNSSKLLLSDDFKTTSSLPGLYLYLSNNTSSVANALEVGAVTQFEGSQQFDLPSSVQLRDYSHVLFYCKPFGVPVGQGEFMP